MLRLLGPVGWISGDGPVDLGPSKQKLVVAALAVDVGRVVPWPTLTGRVWGDEHTPPNPRRVLYTYVNQIRRTLESISVDGAASPVVVRQPGGYELRLASDLVDLHRFRRLATAARMSTCDDRGRVDALEQALRLWHGAALGDLTGSWAERTRTAWAAERIAVTVEWAEALVRLGRHDRVGGPVRALLADEPRAESLVAVLMRALVADGLATEAVEIFATYRAGLIDELGVEPGQRLHDLHAAILRGDLRVDCGRRNATGVTGPVDVPPPAQLPGDVAGFTGRAAEITALDDLLTGGPDTPASTATVISVVSGTAGVGKTALATHWAHRVRDRFPDGQLFVDLRGYSGGSPASPDEALAQMLTALGVGGADMPVGVEPRAGLYRTMLAARRMVILLDNAVSSDQVRPLLPGTPTVTVLVTSRDTLAGLVALHGARRLRLDLLPAADAVTLLGKLVGRARIAAEPHAAARLVEQCSRLPLALRLAAELAVRRPDSSVAELVDELADRRRRLTVLGDPNDCRAAIDTVFSWSFEHLPADAARAFRLFALHPGTDLAAPAVAALTGTAQSTADRLIDALTRAHLVNRVGNGRYGMHDLLRAYADDMCQRHDSHHDRQSALSRLFDHYVDMVSTAVQVLFPPSPAAAPAAESTEQVDQTAALAWIDSERLNLVAICAASSEAGMPGHAVLLADLLLRYVLSGHYADGRAIYQHAIAAATTGGLRNAEARLRSGLGAIEMFMGRHEQARTLHHEALRLAEDLGDHAVQAAALDRLGLLEGRCGNFTRAIDLHTAAVAAYRDLDSSVGVARGLGNLGNILWRLGRDDEAAGHAREALAIFTDLGDRMSQANALNTLGVLEWRAGRYREAIEYGRRSLGIFTALGNRYGEARVLGNLGMAYTSLGRHTEAVDLNQRSLELFQQTDDRGGAAAALNGLGEACHGAGRHADALRYHTEALVAALDGGTRDEQSRAHAGLARAHETTNDITNARIHWRNAADGFSPSGSIRADEARTNLARLDDSS